MKTAIARLAFGFGLALLAPSLVRAQDENDPISVGLRPALEAYEPEGRGKLLLTFTMEKPWHIYGPKEKNGQPTKVVPQPAKGIVWGKPEFPKPGEMEFAGVGKIAVYEGETVVQIPFRIAKGAVGRIPVKIRVDYTACTDKVCKPPVEGRDVEATLFVMPKERIAILVKTDKDSYKAGDRGTATVRFIMRKPWHIYGPKEKKLLPTKVVPQPAKGIEWGTPAYPEPGKMEFQGVGTIEVYEHEVAVRIPFTVKAGTASQGRLKFLVDYQLCTNKACLRPNPGVVFEVPLKVQEGGKEEEGAAPRPSSEDRSFLFMLGLAFAGGLLLNVMPCVLPVLMVKMVSLVGQKGGGGGVRRAAAISYTAGVLVCLNGFAAGVVILRWLGQQVGWGFQFQEPAFVIALATLIFVFALNLLGVFELPTVAGGVAAKGARKHGWLGHFFTGLFITLVATPCSAPFLGTGLGFAFALPQWGVFLFFSAAGMGLAFPFLLIGFVPFLFRFLPKPGAWLDVFKKVMGFALIATTVWLADTVASLTGRPGLVGFLAFLTVVGLAAWIFGKWGSPVAPTRAKFLSFLIGAALIAGGAWFFVKTDFSEVRAEVVKLKTEGLDFAEEIPWQRFTEENVAKIRSLKRPGFIDFTADW